MDKLESLRIIVKKLYPDVSFVIRITKKGKYEIIFKNIKDYNVFLENEGRASIRLIDNKLIPIDTFAHTIQGFFPFFTKENSVIKIMMKNGKIVKLNG